MNIVLVSHCNFFGQSSYHVHSIAKELKALGCECIICVPDSAELAAQQVTPAVPIVDYNTVLEHGFVFPDGGCPTLIHCWTPREHVRLFTQTIIDRYKCPYVVHLEDNEFEILERTLKSLFNNGVIKNHSQIQDGVIKRNLIRPSLHWRFMRNAAGITVLMDRLLEHVPDGTPARVFWPGYDEIFSEIPVSDQAELRKKYCVPDDAFVILYSGAFHAVNQEEIEQMLLAFGQLKNQGIPLLFLKTGSNELPDIADQIIHDSNMTDMGFMPRSRLPELLAIADVIIQPGASDAFNDFRFPSKLPEALISGKPVILPHSNLGRFLVNEVQAIITETGDSYELAGKLSMLYANPELRRTIGANGQAFAQKYLHWESAAKTIFSCYRDFCLTAALATSASKDLSIASMVLNKENEKLKYLVMERNAQITAMNGIVVGLSQTLVEQDAKISILNKAIAEQDTKISILNKAIAEQDTVISSLKNSRSWRITRPLRLAGRILRGDWKSIKDYFVRNRNNCSGKP